MMNRIIFTLLTVIVVGANAEAQRQIKFYTNTQKVDQNRYEGVLGSAFLYKDWMNATIVDDQDSIYDNIKINYNSYEGHFEVLNNDEYIILDEKHYTKITIDTEKGPQTFEKGLNSKFKDKFYLVVHKGEKVTCYVDNAVGMTENTIQDVGKTRVQKRFKADPIHHFKIEGKETWVRLNKRKLTEVLGNKKAVDSFIKKNKLKINSASDLGKLLNHYESQIIQQ